MKKQKLFFVSIAALFFGAVFIFGAFLGKAAGFLKKETRTASSFASETQNWGLGFTEPGKKPTGTVTSEELARNNAYYVPVSYTHLPSYVGLLN